MLILPAYPLPQDGAGGSVPPPQSYIESCSSQLVSTSRTVIKFSEIPIKTGDPEMPETNQLGLAYPRMRWGLLLASADFCARSVKSGR